MAMEQERCAEAKRLGQIDDAFVKGDLEALRAAVDDPTLVPNGRTPRNRGRSEYSGGRRVSTAHRCVELRPARGGRDEAY
jgi:hypothetical protein